MSSTIMATQKKKPGSDRAGQTGRKDSVRKTIVYDPTDTEVIDFFNAQPGHTSSWAVVTLIRMFVRAYGATSVLDVASQALVDNGGGLFGENRADVSPVSPVRSQASEDLVSDTESDTGSELDESQEPRQNQPVTESDDHSDSTARMTDEVDDVTETAAETASDDPAESADVTADDTEPESAAFDMDRLMSGKRR